MKKTCETCFAHTEKLIDENTLKGYCQFYDCWEDEIAKSETPECWEDFPADYYDTHTCDYKNGCCTICGKVEYKSMLYCELYGCDP